MKSNPFLRLLLLAVIAPGTTGFAQDFMDHTYQAVAGTFTWHQAKLDAESRGGHLATITSQAEYDYIRSLGVLPSASYFLGATDEETEGVWTWVTGEPWSFTAWKAGEPNNLGNEDYLLSSGTPDNHFWNDWGSAGNTLSFYILEVDGSFCSPRQAKATAQVVNGFVVGATVTDVGCGYTNTPTVIIQGGGGTGAAAVAVVTNGRVIAVNIVSAGCCYTNTPRILIASPPFVPTLSIRVSAVKVTQHVVLGRNYVLESSHDLVSWTPTGPAFTAQSESVDSEFDVDLTGRFFRIREVP